MNPFFRSFSHWQHKIFSSHEDASCVFPCTQDCGEANHEELSRSRAAAEKRIAESRSRSLLEGSSFPDSALADRSNSYKN